MTAGGADQAGSLAGGEREESVDRGFQRAGVVLDLGEEQAALDRGEALADAGAEVAAGDLDVPASIDDAMKGVTPWS